ncbi:MAG: hypothetical protein JNL58_18300 [Planctomyces sp.]|nr:hypothetical protein [Planctomyces sp.]
MTEEFTVAGDVVQPANYLIPLNQPISLQQAVLSAGPAAESLIVMIVRPGQAETHWTQFVSRSSGESGPPVLPGDILIVQAQSLPDQQVAPNAVLLAGKKPVVLSLRASENQKVRIGDVLAVNQLPTEVASQLRRLSFHPGRSQAKALTAFEPVEHGDVLKLATPTPSQTDHITSANDGQKQFRPMVSEWNGSVSQVSAVQVSGTVNSAFMMSQEQVQPPQIPETPQQPSGVSADYGDVSDSSASLIQTQEEEGHGLPQQSNPETLLPELAVSDSTHRSQSDSAPANSETNSRDVSANDSFEVFGPMPADFEESAPLPPEEIPVAEEASSLNVWNLAFVAGLFIAGGLNIAGWIKSEAELKQLERAQVTSDHLTDVAVESLAGNVLTEPVHTAPETEPLDVKMAPVAPTVTITTPVVPLVASHEWRAKDWRVIVDEIQATQPKPGISSGLTSETTIFNTLETVESATPIHNVEQRIDIIAPVSMLMEATHEMNHEHHTDDAAAPEATESSEIDGPIFGDLNDLIENRLPVDLCEAQLPLRIALFGNAAGPRRLRVDQAHTQLAGPHMSMATERRRTEPAAVTSAPPANEHTDALPQTENSPAPKRHRASLDRALNQLNEQGE